MPSSYQGQLVKYLITSGDLRTPELIDTFYQVDRRDFVLKEYRSEAYQDYPLSIGYGQTISQPTTVAFMLELLDPRGGQHILDIGSGSGWTTALLAYRVGATGHVTATELVPELVTFGRKNLAKYPSLNANIIQAGSELGIPGDRFDRILVSASASTLPDEPLNQLNNGGKLVIPIENSIFLYEKNNQGGIYSKEYPGFIFVPLMRVPHIKK